MSNNKSKITWIFLAIWIALIIGWIFWIPFQPSRLYRAIPANAVFVSSHDNIAGRWKCLSTNVLLKSLVSRIPVFPGKSSILPDFVKTKTWMAHLASRKTVIGFVPSTEYSGEPTWIAASWIGNASIYMRWLLRWKSIRAISLLGNYGGRFMWGLNQPITESGMKLSFAIGEGMILCCLSHDPIGIRQVIKTYDSTRSGSDLQLKVNSLLSIHTHGKTNLTFNLRSDPQDRGVIRLPWTSSHTHNPVFISYSIPLLTPDGLTADIHIHSNMTAYTPITETVDLSIPGKLLNDFPAITIILPLNMTIDLLTACPAFPPKALASAKPSAVAARQSAATARRQPAEPGFLAHPKSTDVSKNLSHIIWIKTIKNLLKSNHVTFKNNAFVLSALTGKYSGEFGLSALMGDKNKGTEYDVLRVKIPAVMGMVKIKHAESVSILINQALNTLNTESRMGLFVNPVPIQAGNQSVYTIESTKNNFLSALAVKDRPAYSVYKNWLIFSTNARSLIKLLEQTQGPDADILTGKWQEELQATRASAFAWLNLHSVNKTLQLPLFLYSQKLKASHTSSSYRAKLDPAIIKSWFRDVRHLKTCTIWMEPLESQPVIHIEIGKPKQNGNYSATKALSHEEEKNF